jgi:peptidoglycan/xylan/chitin deacetylase (PgdA/CDA1 family)
MLLKRMQGKCQRSLSDLLFRRTVHMRNRVPLVTFTFDDFPQSALTVGGKILHGYWAAGTYYVSLGLLGQIAPTGLICSAEDVQDVCLNGHELGCHTFSHCDAWTTDSGAFEESIKANRAALKQIVPTANFLTMAYPINNPWPASKRKAGKYFIGCRGGGQRINVGTVDLNQLSAYFIEQARDSPSKIFDMISYNRDQGGWLILSTHDVTTNPTRFGCTPHLFESIVRRAKESGAQVVPATVALREVCGNDCIL